MAHNHDHDHSEKGGGKAAEGGIDCCAHHELAKIDRLIPIYLIGGVLVLTTLVLNGFGLQQDQIAQIPALLGALLLGGPLFWAAWIELKNGKPASSTLVALAIASALVVEKYSTAGMLAFVLLLADQILRRTAFGAQRAIEQLIGLTPDTARIVENGEEREVPLESVTIGTIVRVRPGENLPVDGRIVSGRSTINQASLTGEAMPIEAAVESDVYAGTTNLTGQIDMEATLVGEDTTIGKVTTLIREAEGTKTPRQLLIEKVAEFFVPIALTVAAIVWYVTSQSDNPAVREEAALRAITVLVVSCPAALVLASPTAMMAAFASAARLGIMIKQAHYLEAAGNIDAVVFDKTGTITTGNFEVSKLVPADGVEGAELLKAAAYGEQHSNHPLAQSIMTTAKAAKISPDVSDDFEEIHGRGVRARTTLGEVKVGRSSWLLELHPDTRSKIEAVEKKIEGMSGVHVMLDGRYLGVVGLEDKVRANTKGVITKLRDLGARTVAIFTGDRVSVARRVGVAVGVDVVEAECLPEEKHEQIQGLVERGYRVMMIGDGINDGPSLAAADVGVAMGLAGSDIATNSAGVALMTDELNRVPFLMELSRKTRTIIAQNVAASILIAIVGLILASTGLLNVGFAALYHFVGEIFVVGNSFRLFRFGESFVAAEQEQKKATPTVKRREASLRGLSGQPAAAG